MEKSLPFLTAELATQIEESITFFSTEKQKALQALPDNPYGVQICSFGKITACLVQNVWPNELFHHVGNMNNDHLPSLDALIEWYQSNGTSCHFDLVPSQNSRLALWKLASQGFYQSGFYNVLYGLPQTSHTQTANIEVRPVLPGEENLFAEIYLESFEVPKTALYEYLRESIRVLLKVPTNSCFFASIKMAVAAIAVLSLSNQIGYLALAATLPSFRGYGCHKALLQTRIQKAAQAGCHLIVGQAGVATRSQQNMEDAGLRLAYTKSLWSRYEQHIHPENAFTSINR